MNMRQYSSHEVLSCLHHKQSRVSNFQFSGFESVIEWQKLAAKRKDWARIERMQLCLESRLECEQTAVVLERTRILQSLDIDLNHMSPVSDTDYEDGLPTMNLLLGKINPDNQCSQLTSLRMSRIVFSDDNYANCKLLKLPGLKRLTLHDCRHHDCFLEQLAKVSLDLDSFSLFEEPESFYEQNFAACSEVFLRSMNSPRHITLVLEGEDVDNTTLEASYFQGYASSITLLKLQIHQCSALSWFVKTADFRQFCNRASSLQQLSISGIEVRPTLCEQPGGLKHFLVLLS